MERMARRTFVLICGAWHGSWCWYRVIARLQGAGHTTLAPDLPGCTADSAAAAAVTLESWTEFLCRIVESIPEPVILVGHSRGGIIMSQVAERMPLKIKSLVYVSGFLLRRGQSVLRMLREDGTSALLTSAVLSKDKNSWSIAENLLADLFYGECPRADVVLAQSRLVPEPAAPLMTPIRVSEENFARVPRVYIECLRDKAIPSGLQKRMYTALPCSRVLSLATDHSPFFSTPDELAEHLLSCVD